MGEVSKIQNEIRNAKEAIAIQEHKQELESHGRDFIHLATTECVSPEFQHFHDWSLDALKNHIEMLERDISLIRGRE